MHRSASPLLLLALFVAGAGMLLAMPACTTIGGATIGPTLQKHSLELARQIEEGGLILEDAALADYVSSIGERLVEQTSGAPDRSFHFAVLDAQEPNAFALPSGHVYISRGLLVLMSSEDELAGVLGHEIGHVVEQHSLRQTTGQMAFAPIRLVTWIGGSITGLVLPRVGGAIAASGELPAALTGASYSRSQENEADEVGQDLAASGGWDPAALSLVMDALARAQALQGQDPTASSWFATHPTSPDRAARIRARAEGLTEAPAHRIASSKAAFLERLDGLVVGESAKRGLFDGPEFLHPELGFSFRLPPGDDWVRVNTDEAVVALRESPRAAVVLQLVGEGDDPMSVARAFEPSTGKLDGPPQAEKVNGLPTARATGGVSGGWGRPAIRASIRWVAHEGLVYRIVCQSTEEDRASLADEFDAVERSFRTLTSADRDRILESRLRIEPAKSGEDLAGLLERVGSDWPLPEAAAANAIDADSPLDAGQPVKVTRRERFELDSPN